MNLGIIYLAAAGTLLFGAGFFAAKRAFPQLQSKQVGLIALIAIVTVGLIWVALDFAGRKQEAAPSSTQRSPLQPDQNPP